MFKNFLKEEEGLATVEIVLILVILVGLVVLFKNAIGSFFTKVTNKIKSDGNSIVDSPIGGGN